MLPLKAKAAVKLWSREYISFCLAAAAPGTSGAVTAHVQILFLPMDD
jgi:hypothetical protein